MKHEFEKAWKKLKQKGSNHYKGNKGKIEPIDLYLSGGIVKHFAIGNIIKYAFRNRNKIVDESDMDKIIHYAEMLKFLAKIERKGR